jgi:hypothetical protein
MRLAAVLLLTHFPHQTEVVLLHFSKAVLEDKDAVVRYVHLTYTHVSVFFCTA